MMMRFARLAMLAVLLVAAPGYAAEFAGVTKSGPTGLRTTYTIGANRAINDFTTAIPACPSMRITFARSTAAVVSVYAVSPTDDTVAEIEAATLVDQLNVDEAITVTQSALFYRAVIDTAESSATPSFLEVMCGTNVGGGGAGGGVTLVTVPGLPGTGDPAITYRITNATDGSDCDNIGGGTEQADCRWNGTTYEPTSQGTAGLANVVEDLTPDLGGPLNLNGQPVISKLTQSPPVNTDSVNSPSNRSQEEKNAYFAIDGAKNLCVDSFSIGGPPQTSGPADGLCDSDGVTKAGKTKVYGENATVVNLTQTEAYGAHIELIGGGDTDAVGLETYVRATGGAQDEGDEGAQVGRNFVTDSYYAVQGTISGTLAAGAGAATITIGGASLSPTESQLVGENKWLVFNTNASAGAVAQDVDIVALPPGAVSCVDLFNVPAAGLQPPQTSGTPDGFCDATGTVGGVETAGWTTGAGKTWNIENNIVASSGVGGGWCFAAKDSAYLDYNGVSSYMWLPISASGAGDGSMDTITTDIMIQGVNHGIPRGYLATPGTNEGIIAPCVLIDSPTLNSSEVVTAVNVVRPTGFDGTDSGAAFVVSEYPNQLLMGARYQVQRAHGSGLPQTGVQAANLLTPGPGRYQGAAAFEATFSASSGRPNSILKDGAAHAWKYGLQCRAGACENGIFYEYEPDPNDAFGPLYNQYPMLLSWATEDWDDDIDRIVMRTANSSGHNLTLDKTKGWGQNGEEFLRASNVGSYALPLAGGTMTGPIRSNGDLDFRIDFDNNTSNLFRVYKGAGSSSTDLLLSVDETGFATALGGFTASGGNISAGSIGLGNRGVINLIGGDALGPNPANLYRVLAPLTGSTNVDFYVPNAFGSNGWGLITNGSGTTSWADMASQAELDAKSAPTTTDNRILRADGTTGDVQDSAASIDDTGNFSTPGTITSTAGTDNSTRKLVLQTNTSALGEPGTGECALGWVGTTLNQHCNGGSLTPVGGGGGLAAGSQRAALRAKPIYYNDFTGGQTVNLGREMMDWLDLSQISTGTTVQVGDDFTVIPQENHPGLVAIRANAAGTANSGILISTAFQGAGTGHIDLDGGEVAEWIFTIQETTGIIARAGFHDAGSATAPDNGIYIELNGDLDADCIAANGGTRTTNTTFATLSADTFYRFEVEVNSDKTSATCKIFNEAGTQVGSTSTVSTNLPADNAITNFALAVTHTAGSANLHLAWVDWAALEFTRSLVR